MGKFIFSIPRGILVRTRWRPSSGAGRSEHQEARKEGMQTPHLAAEGCREAWSSRAGSVTHGCGIESVPQTSSAPSSGGTDAPSPPVHPPRWANLWPRAWAGGWRAASSGCKSGFRRRKGGRAWAAGRGCPRCHPLAAGGLCGRDNLPPPTLLQSGKGAAVHSHMDNWLLGTAAV